MKVKIAGEMIGVWIFPMDNKKMSNVGGFTLIELLVVVAIIGILATIGLTAYSGIQAKARDTKRVDDAKKLITYVELFRSSNNRYPGTTCWWCNSTAGSQWIPEIDVSDFPKGIPSDPKNSSPLIYQYTSDGNDYCLTILQETNAASHEYFKQTSGSYWELRFGPQGPNRGLCQSR